MNIAQAKEEIKRTVQIYLDRDEMGEYTIPYMKQRPIFMIGAPGIGKTAIVEQIAQEMGIGLVSYALTHHTRQSAIGLPYISERKFGGEQVRISEYTMSEILAAVYAIIEETGTEQGILFLDEINCVSETLAPAILQFLQYKTFGNRQLPRGWVVVSAGNPPQYNKSVRDFDIATRDRLKYLYVEEDFSAWKTYAYDRRVHGAILAFLEINRSWFYSIQTTADGPEFATARGWEDLSFALKNYEKFSFPVDTTLIFQYITDQKIGRKFSVYYDLYQKYRQEYEVQGILDGKWGDKLVERAKAGKFDERIALIEMLLEELGARFVDVLENQEVLQKAAVQLRLLKAASKEAGKTTEDLLEMLENSVFSIEQEGKEKQQAGNASQSGQRVRRRVVELLRGFSKPVAGGSDAADSFKKLKRDFDKRAKAQAKQLDGVGDELEHVFAFLDAAFGAGQEMTYFITVLTSGSASSSFLALHGSESYYKYNDRLLLFDVKEKLREEIAGELGL